MRAAPSRALVAELMAWVDRRVTAERTGYLALLELRLDATRRPELRAELTATVREALEADIRFHLSPADARRRLGLRGISSITAALLAQQVVAEVIRWIEESGGTAPVYLSANIPGGDEHNRALEARYAGRIRRTA
ncbi:hypothetical protein [Saccharothrix sp. ST-888]|uniref:hypothetical protein n=1 Tax=Saccharothrix sp. ST-888 TaxID=1427391 RepID=UPI000B202E51|nr:hypothetical protein [Saccharothrix sp. ST-888]